jgi:hypothetical protein
LTTFINSYLSSPETQSFTHTNLAHSSILRKIQLTTVHWVQGILRKIQLTTVHWVHGILRKIQLTTVHWVQGILRKIQLTTVHCVFNHWRVYSSEPTSQDTKPRVQPGVHLPPVYITNVGGEPWVKPGVLRPEMWALIQYTVHNFAKCAYWGMVKFSEFISFTKRETVSKDLNSCSN